MHVRHMQKFAAVAALGFGVWAVAVTFTPVGASFTAGQPVSAAAFNAAFDTVDANFAAAETAIDALELAQPGVSYVRMPTASSVVLPPATTAVDIVSATVDVPAPGFVIANASAYVRFDHTTGGGSNWVNFWVSDESATFDVTALTSTSVPSAAPTGAYRNQVMSQRVFAVTPGTFTAHASSRYETQGAGSVALYYGSLVLTYLPTAVGPVAGSGVGPTATGGAATER